MSAPSPPDRAILSARTQKGAISAHAPGAMSFRKMERHVKVRKLFTVPLNLVTT